MENNEPAQKRENPLLGRKIFFINPHLIIENYIVTELRNDEYEVYVIDDYRNAKGILECFEDALVFVDIDNGLTYDEWFNFIKSFQLNEKLKSIFIGVVTSKATTAEQEHFVMNLSLPGGFIIVNKKEIEANLQKIKDILTLNGAKGCRKYIRLDSKNLDRVNGYFAYRDRLYTFAVDNISSVGFACYYPLEIGEILKKNTLHPCISLTLGRRTVIASSVVLDTKLTTDKGFSVLLFTKDVDRETRNQIRAFIFEVLDEKLKTLISKVKFDLIDYSKDIVLPDEDGTMNVSVETCEQELQEVEDTSEGVNAEAVAETTSETTTESATETPAEPTSAPHTDSETNSEA